MNKAATLLIRTPEGVVFSQLLAGPVSRFLAWLIDLGVLTAAIGLLGMLILILSVIGGAAMLGLGLLLYFVLSVGYPIFFEWAWRGQTIGKRILRLRVVDLQGLRLRFSQVAVRNLLRVVDLMPLCYLVGGVACVVSRRAQRLGDLAANTVVIRIPRLAEPNLDQLMAGKYNSLRAYPHLAARLRQRVSAAEAALALQALVRRDLLEAHARLELFAELAAHFRSKVSFPPEASENVTDEQYVRNVVDVLYRSHRLAAGTSSASSSPAPTPAAPAAVIRNDGS